MSEWHDQGFDSLYEYELYKRVQELESKLQAQVDALRPLVRAARSWHNFHHGSTIVQCDDICEALPAAEEALK